MIMKRKILLVFGTRPEAIKMMPLVLRLADRPDLFETEVCVTGQHRDMLQQVLDIYNVRPDYNLDIMRDGQDLSDITSKVLLGMRDILSLAMPDMVLVHGDTTTSVAAALAAFYAKIPVGHVEAGLRTYDLNNPWPEELNRQITSRIANIHFTPTERSRNNLIREGVPSDSVIVTGNTVIDNLLNTVKYIGANGPLSAGLEEDIKSLGYTIKEGRRIVLVTGHRRENFGQGLRNICRALDSLASRYPEVDFIYPLHPNPNVSKAVKKFLSDKYHNIFLISPLPYLCFVHLMERTYLILTDSGGIQEEAPSLGIPVLVLREVTERPEAVQAGTVKLVGTDSDTIINEVSELLDDKDSYQRMCKSVNPYGDGRASERIIESLHEFFANI